MTYARAFEVVGDRADAGPFVFTCEHASNAVPAEMVLSASDTELLQTHWGWDIGARMVVLELVELLGGQAILSGFSRLVIDPNRAPGDSSSIRLECEGQFVDCNRDLDADTIGRRHTEFFHAFHDEVARVVAERAALQHPFRMLSIHSFTPQYLGHKRPMEIGILFNRHDHLAFDLEQSMSSEGFETALNAPYSGKGEEGLIYSIERHAGQAEVPYLELEIRQDLIESDEGARAVARRMARALEVFRPAPSAY